MSITPQGLPIIQIYRWYREGSLIVNRRYQRKLVWTTEEKQKLIESILAGYPIPLILLAKVEQEQYEIMDGMQRLNAIFSFIENVYSLKNGAYFEVENFPSAKKYSDEGLFERVINKEFLSAKECADLVEYQLAITIYPSADHESITDIFGRINSSGKQLSAQEQRQAGVVSTFADLVRQVASELRGDVSAEILLLNQMPEISIDSRHFGQGYRLKAQDIFWCRQGIIRNNELRDSVDEELVADIAASILLNRPIPRSKTLLDNFYSSKSKDYREVEVALNRYKPENLSEDIKSTFSILRSTIEKVDDNSGALSRILNPRAGGNPIRTAFYAVFMAFFDLVIKQGKTPSDAGAIMAALSNLHSKLTRPSSNVIRTEIRVEHINLTKGLIQDYFVQADPPALGHGSTLVLDFENSVRRSKIESNRYEFKQGFLSLDESRKYNQDLEKRVLEHICGIANVGENGFIHIGVADTEKDALRIEGLDNCQAIQIDQYFVVGVEREANLLNQTLEQYVDRITEVFLNSELSEPLRSQIVSGIDPIQYKNLTVIRIAIPKQKSISFVGNRTFTRDGSKTIDITNEPRRVASLQAKFSGQV